MVVADAFRSHRGFRCGVGLNSLYREIETAGVRWREYGTRRDDVLRMPCMSGHRERPEHLETWPKGRQVDAATSAERSVFKLATATPPTHWAWVHVADLVSLAAGDESSVPSARAVSIARPSGPKDLSDVAA